MKTYFLLLSVLFLSLPLAGQENAVKVPENSSGFNSFTITAGAFPTYGNLQAGYEMAFERGPQKIVHYMGFRAQAGMWVLWEDTGWDLSASCFWLLGKRSSFIELGTGLTYLDYITTAGWHLLPAGNIGYRYMKPGKRYFFRAGIGFPECFYLGAGLTF